MCTFFILIKVNIYICTCNVQRAVQRARKPCICGLLTWESSQLFGTPITGFPMKWRQRNKHRNFILMIWVVLLIGRSTNQNWVVVCHQKGISALFLNCHFVRKQVVASQNVSSFLSLVTYIKHLNDYDLH